MNIDSYIKNWAQIILKESFDESENGESYEIENNNSLHEAILFINNYAKKNGYEFDIGGVTYNKIDYAFELMEEKIRRVLRTTADDEEKRTPSVYDDSSDDESNSDFNFNSKREDEIETEEQLREMNDDFVRRYFDWKKNGNGQDYVAWLREHDDNGESRVCWNEDYDFGITLEKKR